MASDALGVAFADQADKFKTDFRQPRPQCLMQSVGKQVFMVVRIAQNTEEFQPQYPPQGIRYFDGVGICRSCFQTAYR